MHRAFFQTAFAHGSLAWLPLLILVASPASLVVADSLVEFDFARTAECRDVTPDERLMHYPSQRLVEVVLPISVRFHGVPLDQVDELTVEITGAASNMRVFDFKPSTQMASDIANPIETTTTKKSARAIDGSLGGALPMPLGAEVANVTPTINAGMSKGEVTTEKLDRLPPKYAVVVSGTTAEGRGVFFKMKRWSQTSLEGVHELAVTFIVPAGWRGGDVFVGCSAGGQRKVLFMKQSATLGSEGKPVRVYLAGRANVRHVAKPVVAEVAPEWKPSRGASATAAEVAPIKPEVVKAKAVRREVEH